MVVFRKTMSKSDLSKLHVPIKALGHFTMPDGIDYVTLLVKGASNDHVHELRLSKKQKQVNGKLYSELRITRGWPKFAKSRGIEEGDEIIFHKKDDKVGVVYICEVVKKSASSSSNAGLEGMNHDVVMDNDQMFHNPLMLQVDAGMNFDHTPPILQVDAGMNFDQMVHNLPILQVDGGMHNDQTYHNPPMLQVDAGMNFDQMVNNPPILQADAGMYFDQMSHNLIMQMHEDGHDADQVLMSNGISAWNSSYMVCQYCFNQIQYCSCN